MGSSCLVAAPFAPSDLPHLHVSSPAIRQPFACSKCSGPNTASTKLRRGLPRRFAPKHRTVTGRDDLIRDGKAQQDKAEAERDVAKKEAEAESARGAAKTAEERQKANQ